jgi:hypothetical protein
MVVKSRSVGRAGHVTRMNTRNAYTILVGKPEAKYDSEDLEVDGRLLLQLILEKKW